MNTIITGRAGFERFRYVDNFKIVNFSILIEFWHNAIEAEIVQLFPDMHVYTDVFVSSDIPFTKISKYNERSIK